MLCIMIKYYLSVQMVGFLLPGKTSESRHSQKFETDINKGTNKFIPMVESRNAGHQKI